MFSDRAAKSGGPDPGPEGQTIHRAETRSPVRGSRFVVSRRSFCRPYAHLYAVRLALMRPVLASSARTTWGSDLDIKKMFELQVGVRCCVIGTMYKHMELRPSILKEISGELSLVPQPVRMRYTDPSDELILEDELQRMKIVGSLDPSDFVTGLVVAVLGVEKEDGKFHVEDICLAGIPPQLTFTVPEHDRFVLLASGLGLGGQVGDATLGLQLLIDTIIGQLGGLGEQRAASQISRVILAGNLLSRDTQSKDILNKAKYLTKKTQAASVEAVKVLDDALFQLCTSVDVDAMPGEFDPANHTLPQQPLHRCMLPHSQPLSTLHLVTNPYEADIDGVRFLGTSGQNIRDIYKYSGMDDWLHILEWTLRTGHMAPTAPDTLGCYPYYSEDPFILKESPHVYFCGNAPSFQSKILHGSEGQRVLLLSVPDFCTTRTACLVCLRDLDCQPIKFSVFADNGDGTEAGAMA
uniref:DNA polymerase delta subunit 2 n=1 Tax=Eptatretus burgeri TaxID=7764 RepID=A0A8C4PZ91_EPTBU